MSTHRCERSAPNSSVDMWARTVADATIAQIDSDGAIAGTRCMRVRPMTADEGLQPIPLPGACFSSGATNYPDLIALVAMGSPVGINAWDASTEVMDRCSAYAAAGGRVFFDSGAFHEFASPVEIIDFNQVFASYDRVIADLDGDARRRVTLVMPDRVMHQNRSLERLAEHADRIRDYIDQGIDCLIPIQKPSPAHPERGMRSLADLYRESLSTIGAQDGQVRPALPCKRAACTLDDVRAFIEETRPAGLHLLGRSLDAPVNAAWRATIADAAPMAVVTSDSCEVTALLGSGRPLTDRQRALSTAMTDRAMRGVSELACSQLLYEQPGAVDLETAQRLAERLGLQQERAQAFAAATQRPTTRSWETRMRASGWEAVTPWWQESSAQIAHDRPVTHRCAAGYLIDQIPDGMEIAGEVVYQSVKDRVTTHMQRLVRGLAAYDAIGLTRTARAGRKVLLQQTIFGGYDMAR